MAGKKVLLVEGKDDEHVIRHICGNCGGPHLDAIRTHGGSDELLRTFPVSLKGSDLETLGVIVDADTNLDARWQSLRDSMRNAGYVNVPDEPVPDGAVIEPPAHALLPRAGVWIMPDNRTSGILEDFLQFLIPTGSALFDRVKSSVDGIPETERLFKDEKKTKAIIHTWLAWQKEPGKPLGQAVTARYLDPTKAPQAALLTSWLNRLFA